MQGSTYARPIESLFRGKISFVIEYDASLTGIGLVLSGWDAELGVARVMKVSKIVLPFDLGVDSSFQNSMEFVAVVMGIACLGAMGYSQAKVRIIGNNTSSLAWSVKSSFREGRSRGAAICMVNISTRLGLEVNEGVHISGSTNEVCDGMSRDKWPTDYGFVDSQCISVENDWRLSLLLNLCNPLRSIDVISGFLETWSQSRRVAAALG